MLTGQIKTCSQISMVLVTTMFMLPGGAFHRSLLEMYFSLIISSLRWPLAAGHISWLKPSDQWCQDNPKKKDSCILILVLTLNHYYRVPTVMESQL